MKRSDASPPAAPRPKSGRLLFWSIAALGGAGLVWFMVSFVRSTLHPRAYPLRQFTKAATSHDDLSRRCIECHREEYDDWLHSQHARAQRPITQEDRDAFIAPQFPREQTTVPQLAAGQPGFRDKTTGEFFPAVASIAIEPLRQYLLPLAGGRFQIAPLAFDPHRKDWFDANNPPRRPHDWSYWSNRGANWNSMCAYCHMTGLEKNYDIATDSYSTTWTTQGISCTQCHGDMTAHLADPENPAKISKLPADLALDNCASCHARREELTGTFGPGERFHDHYRVALPDQPNIYYADGQILDEDFEYGSMLLNRMGHKGITCLDCHNPHSGKLKLPVENNALCMSCHAPPGQNNATPIDPAAHTFHQAGTPGSLCIDCHMAPTTYMVRDPRRDHGFVSPDPQLTIEAGIPNNCNRCHSDQSPEWARDWVDRWYGAEKMESRPARRRARVILRAQKGGPGFDPELLALARSEEIPAWRATLVLLLAPWNQHPDVAPALREWLADPSPLVRSAAIRAMGSFEAPLDLPPEILNDPAGLVRIDANWQHMLRGQAPPHEDEVVAYLANQSDQPAGAMKQTQLAMAREDIPSAVDWVRKAADWDRGSSAAQEMMALVLYAAGKPDEARPAFERALELEPANAQAAFNLALLLGEAGDLPGAIAAFEKAVAADEGYGRAWYNLGLARSQNGDLPKALEALDRAAKTSPGSADPDYAAATIYLRQGRADEARAAIRRALRQNPAHTPSLQLQRRLTTPRPER